VRVSKAWSRSEAFTRHAKKSIPLGRAGDPPEIVGAALYLASDLATYTSGTMIVVDGGQSVGMMPGAFSD
jgi:NAD(P)-dependent dehydrogenase (short-subunit alcohol dehydrogenase family)